MTEQLKVAVGARIRRVRRQCGLTLAELGERVKLSPPQLSQIERGRCEISLSFIERFCKATNVSLQWLVAGEVKHID